MMRNETPGADGYGLDSLTWPERVICGPLIRRQFERDMPIQRDLSRYGRFGTARLCSGAAGAGLARRWCSARKPSDELARQRRFLPLADLNRKVHRSA